MREPRRSTTRIIAAAALIGALAALGACAATPSAPARHPEELTAAPRCSECHDDGKGAYDHTPAFARAHGAAAGRARNLCGSCHRESFCADCHGYREEIPPAEKSADAPERMAPHPRSYELQHRIDGRLNPASCFRCHGRRNDARCIACHR